MKKIIFLSAILIFVSCQFNGSYKNDKDDKADAERVAVDLYNHLENKEFNETHVLFSEDFLQNSDTVKLNEFYKTCVEKLGRVKNKELQDWKTNVIVGSNPKSEYLLVYNVTREKFNSVETLYLLKEDEQIKIQSYNVNSEGLMK